MSGPLFVISAVYVTSAPIATGSGLSESDKERSASGSVTVVVAVAVSSLASLSSASESTVLVTVFVPVEPWRTLSVPSTEPPAGTVPSAQVTTWPTALQPAAGAAAAPAAAWWPR